MARLPSAEALGVVGNTQSGGPMSSIQSGAVGAAMEGFGRSGQRLGGELIGIENRQLDDAAKLGSANADAYLLRQRDAFVEKIREKPDEYANWEKQYTGESQKWMQEAAQQIPDARARALWSARQQSWIESNRAQINRQAFETGKKSYMDFNNSVISDFQTRYLTAQSDEDKARYRETVNGMFDDYVARGYINEGQAKELKKNWAEGTALRWAASLPAGERLAVLGGTGSFRRSLKGSESGQRVGIVNEFGYAGLYQFGAPRLQTIGVYQPGEGENLANWSKTGRGAGGKWSGTFNIPGFPQVKTLQDFRNNPAAQEKVADLHFAEIDKQISSRGLDKYIGQEVGGVKITRDGIHAMAHLGGIGNAASFLQTGGQKNAKDANGTSMRDYAAKFSRGTGGKYQSGTVADIIAPDKREELIRRSETEVRQQQRVEQQQISGIINDDLTAMRTTGVGLPDNEINREMIAKRFGEERAQEWEATRARNRRYFEAMDGVESLPEAEIDRRVRQLEPASRGGDTAQAPEDALVEPAGPQKGYVDDMRAYQEATKQAEKIKQARRADPALAVQSIESVRGAMASRKYEEINGVKSVTPQSAQALIRARLNAQTELGIENPLAFTRAEAQVFARLLRSIGDENPQGMTKFMSELQRVYGEYADEVLSSVLQLAGVNRELSNFTTEILGKVANGVRPSASDAGTFEVLVDSQWLSNSLLPNMPGEDRAWESEQRQPSTAQPSPARSMTPGAMRRAVEERGTPAPQAAQPKAKQGDPPVANYNTPQGTQDALNLMRGTTTVQDFDRKYGAGMGKKVLEELKRRMGR